MSWSSRRKFLYGGSLSLLAFIVVVVPTFLYWYTPSTCSDGIRNQDERGVDCGGPCVRLCQDDFLPPRVAWTKFEWVNEGMYNVSAYIVNPNVNGGAVNIPYLLQLYDDAGILITERKGTMNLSPYRNTLVFEGAMLTQKRVPAKAIFEYLESPRWQKSTDRLGDLWVIDRKYIDEEGASSLQVTLENRSLSPIDDVTLGVVLKDEKDNAIGFSETFLERIAPGERVVAPYTWPIDRGGRVKTIEVVPMTYPRFE